ncbi:putative mitochondrial hypothetical protein [Leptomonas pyrrhocoris]|uniref:Uncharacterized protein n=1 Tax=Leptomonas pyrrhocoris TaxID=157538 RepID=A0A0M9G6H4_LEPPY|nr:putative mitochondrial hypothetical protein [Leptomonas pyrrhocoris]XP_015661970.1 putative mitochondrial hypothetical protein [Leptomonas pyrrhocoris]KPA83530.1 putative mitochondrial hypothetical protein [Leptomonas pyrrhocoris]KPA83531.1 putative mitochondrial hypothetical protein [Leptomonas pyrrhocoris]|eukprot:XP_015661969.1 putative mitochondrial hypothetical protein [Leptomonas pyrrhocoris]
MQATVAEREREIEANIAIREREIASLEQEKADLQAGMAAGNPEMRDDPLLASFPALDYCGKKPRLPIRSIPVEQCGNTMIQLDIAKKAIEQQNQKDRVAIQELLRLIREQEKNRKVITERTAKVVDSAGLDMKSLMARSRRDATKTNQEESETSVAELEARTRLIDREVKAAKVIAEKKGEALVALSKLVDKRRGTIDDVDSLYNQIRIVDRDSAVETEELERLRAETEDADAWLAERPDPAGSVARKVIDEDAANVKGEREQTINEQRIPQERVIKAQDYRIAQLEKRVKVVDAALKNNGLSREVAKIVSRSWSQRDVEVPEDEEELYDIEKIIPAQEKIHPGVYNLLLTEKEKTARNVSILTITSKEKEEVIASLSTKLENLAAQCNAAIQELDIYASEAAFAEEEQRVQALKWVREQRQYCDKLASEKTRLETASHQSY